VAGLAAALAVAAAAFGSILSSRPRLSWAGFALILLGFSALALLGLWRGGWP
jgi:hypothetical protein